MAGRAAGPIGSALRSAGGHEIPETNIQAFNNYPTRIAASSYLNTAPLIWSFLHGTRRDRVNIVTDTAPVRCADMLAQGEVEAALVPVIEYERIPEARFVPGVCVGSRAAVRSVVLVSKYDDLNQVRKVALDEESRTSQALIKIIFREFLGAEPKWQSFTPDLSEMLKTNDAALLIGDPAMTISSQDFHVFDLATLWRNHTGNGFVFAMWMARQAAANQIAEVDFAGARDEGLEHVEEIAEQNEPVLGLPKSELITYLRENISFNLDDDLKSGLELFLDLAHKHQLISNQPSLIMMGE
jgi:chorismate dehydratase